MYIIVWYGRLSIWMNKYHRSSKFVYPDLLGIVKVIDTMVIMSVTKSSNSTAVTLIELLLQ